MVVMPCADRGGVALTWIYLPRPATLTAVNSTVSTVAAAAAATRAPYIGSHRHSRLHTVLWQGRYDQREGDLGNELCPIELSLR